MARRRVKKRTHLGAKAPQNGSKPSASIPKSMVIRINASEVGHSVSQLVKDMRLVMSPHTASRLKERRSNKLRDFTTMAGPLGVTHLLLFSKSEAGNTNFRLCTTPRGPTLSFRVEKYSLCKDVQRSIKRPRGQEEDDYVNPPLLLMNNFQQSGKGETTGNTAKHTISKQLEDLSTTVFRSLFPPIAPQTTPLHTVKRVLLLDRVIPSQGSSNVTSEGESETDAPFVIQMRHYAITTRRTGLPRNIKRISSTKESKHKRLPNLGRLGDVSEYLLDPSAAGYTSASETEIETDAEVEVLASTTRKILDKKQQEKQARRTQEQGSNVEKRAVKLVELGPRMTLRLQKIEEGLAGGKVLWHESFSKTREEERAMDEVWEQRRKEKEERRRIQKENVERKKKEKKDKGEGGNEDEDDDMEDYDDEDFWDDEFEAEDGTNLDAPEDDDIDEEMEDKK